MMLEMKTKLTPLQTEIINIAVNDGFVTPEKILRKYDVTYWTVKMNLNKLYQKGHLQRIHKNKLKFKAK